jgi:hypothetical protein
MSSLCFSKEATKTHLFLLLTICASRSINAGSVFFALQFVAYFWLAIRGMARDAQTVHRDLEPPWSRVLPGPP